MLKDEFQKTKNSMWIVIGVCVVSFIVGTIYHDTDLQWNTPSLIAFIIFIQTVGTKRDYELAKDYLEKPIPSDIKNQSRWIGLVCVLVYVLICYYGILQTANPPKDLGVIFSGTMTSQKVCDLMYCLSYFSFVFYVYNYFARYYIIHKLLK